MPLKIIEHALERMKERGVTEQEVRQILKSGKTTKAKAGRKAKENVLSFNGYWQGRLYKQKKVKVIYAEEDTNLVVITVYAYYGKWEERS